MFGHLLSFVVQGGMEINLSGNYRAMTKQFRKRINVGATLKHESREGMTEHVRADMNFRLGFQFRQQAFDDIIAHLAWECP